MVTEQQLICRQVFDALPGAASAQRINRVHGCHRYIHHAVLALNQQDRTWPSGLPGGGKQGYNLSLNRTKELVHEEVEHRPPLEILAGLRAIELEILQGMEELGGMLR